MRHIELDQGLFVSLDDLLAWLTEAENVKLRCGADTKAEALHEVKEALGTFRNEVEK